MGKAVAPQGRQRFKAFRKWWGFLSSALPFRPPIRGSSLDVHALKINSALMVLKSPGCLGLDLRWFRVHFPLAIGEGTYFPKNLALHSRATSHLTGHLPTGLPCTGIHSQLAQALPEGPLVALKPRWHLRPLFKPLQLEHFLSHGVSRGQNDKLFVFVSFCFYHFLWNLGLFSILPFFIFWGLSQT